MLRACVQRVDQGDADDEPPWYQPFCSMVEKIDSGKWTYLTDRQRGWVRGVYEKLFDEPQYDNLWSSGKVPKGNYGKTPTPEVLLKRPLKPPGRP